MASKVEPFTIRNLAVTTFYSSLLSAALFGVASLERVNIPVGFSEDGRHFNVQSQPSPNKPLYFVFSLLSLAIAGVHISAKIGDKELIDFDNIGEDTADTLEKLIKMGVVKAGELVGEGLKLGLGATKETAKTLYLMAPPTPIKTWLSESVANQNWFGQFLRGHAWVTGETGSGKTFLILKLIIDWIERNPNTSILICDINYGKPNPETGRLNDWMGIDPAYVQTTSETIEAAIASEYAELENRRSTCTAAAKAAIEAGDIPKLDKPFAPRLIMIDELDGLSEEIDDKSDFHTHLRALLKQGRGYSIKVVLCGQSRAKNASSITLATAKQLNCLRVIKDKVDKDELRYFGNCDYDLLTEQTTKLRKSGHRVAIAQLGEASPQAVIIPDLSEVEEYRFAKEDKDLIWWNQTYTSEVRAWLKDLASKFAQGEIPSPLKTEIVPKFGVKLLSTDARYTKFVKPEWERLLTEFKE